MSQKEKMKEDLLNDINSYFYQFVYIKDINKVSMDIDNYKTEMQNAPNFKLIIECALYDSLTMALARLYDKSKEAKTIPKLIEKCKNNISLFPDEKDTLEHLKEFEDKIAKDEFVSKAIEVLTERRDTMYAHNDKKFFGPKVVKDTTYLPMYNIWILINFTEEVLNYLFSQLSSKEQMKTKYDGDLKNLFK